MRSQKGLLKGLNGTNYAKRREHFTSADIEITGAEISLQCVIFFQIFLATMFPQHMNLFLLLKGKLGLFYLHSFYRIVTK